VTAAQKSLDAAIDESNRLRKILQKHASLQVKSDDERQLIKAFSHAWFNSHRASLVEALGEDCVQEVDSSYQALLAASNRATTRARYLLWAKGIGKSLSQLQATQAVRLSAVPAASLPPTTNDTPPQFSSLVADAKMQTILENRWQECVRCLDANAPLAATVMMGGILEGLLLARINALTTEEGRANLAEFCPPEPFGGLAIARGYRDAGNCRDGAAPLLKPVVARPADVVELSDRGITVNGRILPNTAPIPTDTKGRPLSPWPFGRHVVQPGTVWVASSFNSRSFDSRYFGPVQISAIRHYLRPLLAAGK
jgi:conjugative transfer signal peptidase TraF